MRFLATIIFAISFLELFCQELPDGVNGIQTVTIKVPGIFDVSMASTPEQKSVINDYYNGIGQLEQRVFWKASPSKRDIIVPFLMDYAGRDSMLFLPYSRLGDGSFDSKAIQADGQYQGSSHQDFYATAADVVLDPKPYALQLYESSPLGRLMEQGAYGEVWQPDMVEGVSIGAGRTTKIEYGFNELNEVKLFRVREDCLVDEGYYNRGVLSRIITRNENWLPEQNEVLSQLNSEVVFKDMEDRIVLKRTFVQSADISQSVVPVETYYVYDGFGKLRFIVPPEAMRQLYSSGVPSSVDFVSDHQTVSELRSDVILVSNEGRLTINPGPSRFVFTASSDKSLMISSFSGKPDLCFSYKYDDRGRLVEKVIPGADPLFIVYDHLNRVVAGQDGEKRKRGEWLFFKYDAFNRPIITGVYFNGVKTQEDMQELVDGYYASGDKLYYERIARSGPLFNYTNQSFPNTVEATHCLNVTYYDNYDWVQGYDISGYLSDLVAQLSYADFSHDDLGSEIVFNPHVKGLVTGKKTRVLDDEGTVLGSIMFYDEKYNPVLVQSDNYVGGEDIVLTKFDFSGNVIDTYKSHTNSISSTEKYLIKNSFIYDHYERKISGQQRLAAISEFNSSFTTEPVLLFENTFNELGQLKNKKIGNSQTSSEPVQERDYSYNIRGWLTGINDPDILPSGKRLFSMRLHYENSELAGVPLRSQYNGNISAFEWRTSGNSSIRTPPLKQVYAFSYDAVNRLTDASYFVSSGISGYTRSNVYDKGMSVGEYDLNGNILQIKRENGFSSIDNLVYQYLGNQLLSVKELATGSSSELGFFDGNLSGIDYLYDANGNLVKDKNKGIEEINYNHLNLVSSITGEDQSQIQYVYSAGAEKLAVVSPGGAITHYSGDFVYQDNKLQQIQHSEGFIDMNNGANYHYYLKDHLGNVRVVVNALGQEVQQNTYYPFGLRIASGGSSDNSNLFRTGELIELNVDDAALGWYDLGARHFSPELGRFFNLDLYSEKNHLRSPYSYASNNPVSFIDYLGLDPIWIPAQFDQNDVWREGGWYDDLTMEPMTAGEVSAWFRTFSGLNLSSTDLAIIMGSGSLDPDLSTYFNSLGSGSEKFIKMPAPFAGTPFDRNGDFVPPAYTNVLGGVYATTNPVMIVSHYSTQEILNAFLYLYGDQNEEGNSVNGASSQGGGVGQPGTWESLIPVWGSGRAAVDHFQNGNYWRGLGYSALAISDVFLVKSLATAAGRGAWKLGAHSWSATRSWLGKNGYAKAGQPVHHWAISQSTAKKYGIEAITNQPWNLKTFANQSIHMRAGHGYNYLGQPGFGTAGQLWYGTPIWPKAVIGSYGGRGVMGIGD